MNARLSAGRVLLGLAVVALLGGCASDPPTVKVTRNVAFEMANQVMEPGVLDVYAPAEAGP